MIKYFFAALAILGAIASIVPTAQAGLDNVGILGRQEGTIRVIPPGQSTPVIVQHFVHTDTGELYVYDGATTFDSGSCYDTYALVVDIGSANVPVWWIDPLGTTTEVTCP